MSLLPDGRNQVTVDISDDEDNQQSADDHMSSRDRTVHTVSRMPGLPGQGLFQILFREITPFLGQVDRINTNVQEPIQNQNGQGSNPQNIPITHRIHINLNPLVETHGRSDSHVTDRAQDISFNERDQPPAVNANTNNSDAEIEEPVRRNRQGEDSDDEPTPQTTTYDLLVLLRGCFKYAPVIVILLAKFMYDYSFGLVSLIVMVITFFYTNQFVKEEAGKHSNMDILRSFWNVMCTICCVLLVEILNNFSQKNWGYLILLPDFDKPTSLWEMLWVLCITDFIIKFITIDLKLIFSCLPEKILPFKRKGKVYSFIEAVSQLYRSIVPIQPWLFYFLEAYTGYEKFFSVVLSTAYIVSKLLEITKKIVLLKSASLKLFDNSNLGTTPNEEQINAAGKMCPICHEEYHTPVLLQCSHIFCETCLVTWFNKVQTCPLCRAQVTKNFFWRDGATSHYIQLY